MGPGVCTWMRSGRHAAMRAIWRRDGQPPRRRSATPHGRERSWSSPEAAVYDPAHDVFFIGGNNFDIKVVNHAGTVLDDITTLTGYRNPTGNIGVDIQGLTLAPASDDPTRMDLYVADQGLVDTNDGRLIEINLHNGLLYA